MHVIINVSVISLPYSFCFLVSIYIVPLAGPVINSRPHDTGVWSRLINVHLVLPSHPRFLPLSISQSEFNSCIPDCPSELPYVGLMRSHNQAFFPSRCRRPPFLCNGRTPCWLWQRLDNLSNASSHWHEISSECTTSHSSKGMWAGSASLSSLKGMPNHLVVNSP